MKMSKLNEKAIDIKKTRSLGFALFVGSGDPKIYLMYDAKGFIEEEILDPDDYSRSKIVLKHVYATLMIAHPYVRGGAWGAKEVEASAARHGYGPLLYDIVMGLEGGLMADRETVSGQAKKVWNHYKMNRSDVTAKPLDDFMNPQTPTKKDDAEVFPGGMKNSLNYAYVIKHAPSVGMLLNNHKTVKKRLGFNNSWFDDVAQGFFEKMYLQ